MLGHSATVIYWLVAASIIAVIVWANVDYCRTVAKMTPKERADFEEELRRDLQLW